MVGQRSASHEFQSTLSVRRATHFPARNVWRQNISIHALREESDCAGLPLQELSVISIHALREESDPPG